MNEQAITITDDEIYILLQFFIHKDYSITYKELLLDIFGKYYTPNKTIRIRAGDGENINFSGFADFMEYVCDLFIIPKSSVIFETHDVPDTRFSHRKLTLGIFCSTKRTIGGFDKNLDNSKFVGVSLGRFNLTRLRLAYELDQAFPNDNYTNFQTNLNFIDTYFRHFSELYKEELSWLSTKTFERDLISTHPIGMVSWNEALPNYGNLWNRYQIEVISETDSISDFWFTEKTARCLCTGKPFVLIAGQHSLLHLREMGFKTFGDVIDESYDRYTNPHERIKHLISSLKMLYNDANRVQKLQKMYEIASENINIYDDYINSQKEK
jgi:hypothetical protein